MRSRNKVVIVPVLLDRVRGPVAGSRSHHGVAGDGIARRVLLRRRQAISACRSHRITRRTGVDWGRDAAVDDLFNDVAVAGMRRSSEGHQSKG